MTTTSVRSSWIGLAIAFCGPPLLAVYGEHLFPFAGTLTNRVLCQLTMVGFAASTVLIALLFERRSLSSIGLQAPYWSSLWYGLMLAAFFIVAFAPLAYWFLARFGLASFDVGLAQMMQSPTWYLVIAVVVGGAVEEVCYRGYALENLTAMTGSLWSAAIISVGAFALAHVPLWGLGPALTTAASGAILTLFYIWRRDLSANIVAHVVTDFVGIVLPRLLGETN